MKNFIIAASAALFISGAFAGSAFAADSHGRNDHRSGQRHMHHSRVCKDIYKKRVVWRHGHRQVVRVKVGRRCF